PASDGALLEPVVLEVLEQVAGEAQLGCGHGPAPLQLERDRGLPVMEDEQVVLAEGLAAARRLQRRRRVAVASDRELERPLEGERQPSALGEDAAGAVEDAQVAAEALVEDVEQRV